MCPSCINRRAEVLSHTLAEKLPEGDYRQLVVTLPKKMGLRKRFQLRIAPNAHRNSGKSGKIHHPSGSLQLTLGTRLS